jgi:hypothetical protein
MIAAGVNVRALAAYMGHSSITVTLDRYGHLDARERGRGSRSLGRLPRRVRASTSRAVVTFPVVRPMAYLQTTTFGRLVSPHVVYERVSVAAQRSL